MVETQIITDELKSMLNVEVEPLVFAIDKSMVRRFIEAVEDDKTLWSDKSSLHKPEPENYLAPATFLTEVCQCWELHNWYISTCPFPDILVAGVEIENFQRVKSGDVVFLTCKMVDLHETMGKKFGKMIFATFENIYKNQKGEIVTKYRITFISYGGYK